MLKDIHSGNISVLNQDVKINIIKIPNLRLPPMPPLGGASSSSRTMAFIDLDQTFANSIIQNQTPTASNHLTTKQYTDNKRKSNPSRSLTNTFGYIMDVDEISTEYGWIADMIDNLSWSFHSSKKILYFKAVKDESNYRYRHTPYSKMASNQGDLDRIARKRGIKGHT